MFIVVFSNYKFLKGTLHVGIGLIGMAPGKKQKFTIDIIKN